MSARLDRIKEEEQQNRKNMGQAHRLSWGVFVVAVIAITLIYNVPDALALPSNDTPAAATAVSIAAHSGAPDDWRLILVNSDNPLPTDFTVKLAPAGEIQLDERVLVPLAQMIQAAMDDGVRLEPAAGYRSVAAQQQLYEDSVAREMPVGSESAARAATQPLLQMPGCSEHHTGLAVDFYFTEYELTQSFSECDAYTWLSQHAREYGFIQRYPENKQKITGVSWEPWHYRYVGVEAANHITDEDLCLEEYLAGLAAQSAAD